MAANIEQSVKQDEQRLLNIFEALHKNPELAYMEFETAALVAKEFKELAYVVHTKIAKTGVVGVMENGPGPVVMFRSDMDALPLKEETDIAYKSTVIKKDSSGHGRYGSDGLPGYRCAHD